MRVVSTTTFTRTSFRPDGVHLRLDFFHGAGFARLGADFANDLEEIAPILLRLNSRAMRLATRLGSSKPLALASAARESGKSSWMVTLIMLFWAEVTGAYRQRDAYRAHPSPTFVSRADNIKHQMPEKVKRACFGLFRLRMPGMREGKISGLKN